MMKQWIFLILCLLPFSLSAMEALQEQDALLEHTPQQSADAHDTVSLSVQIDEQSEQKKEKKRLPNWCNYFIAATVPAVGAGITIYLCYYFHQNFNQ